MKALWSPTPGSGTPNRLFRILLSLFLDRNPLRVKSIGLVFSVHKHNCTVIIKDQSEFGLAAAQRRPILSKSVALLTWRRNQSSPGSEYRSRKMFLYSASLEPSCIFFYSRTFALPSSNTCRRCHFFPGIIIMCQFFKENIDAQCCVRCSSRRCLC